MNPVSLVDLQGSFFFFKLIVCNLSGTKDLKCKMFMAKYRCEKVVCISYYYVLGTRVCWHLNG